MKRLFVHFIERSKTLKSSGNWDLCNLRKLAENLWSLWSLKNTLSGIDDRLLRHVEESSDFGNGLLEAGLGDFTSGNASGGRMAWKSRGDLDSLAEDTTSNILWKVNKDWTWTTGSGDLESLVDSAWELGNGLYHDVPLCAGSADTDNIGLLESIGTDS